MIHKPKDFRKKFGLSQAELAEMLHISRSMLAMVELGRRRFTPEAAESFKALQLRVKNDANVQKSRSFAENVELLKERNLVQRLLRRKEQELHNLTFILTEKYERQEKLVKGLELIQEELKVFSALPNYSSKLEKMKEKYLKRMVMNNTEVIEFIELRIQLLQIIINRVTYFIESKKSKLAKFR